MNIDIEKLEYTKKYLLKLCDLLDHVMQSRSDGAKDEGTTPVEVPLERLQKIWTQFREAVRESCGDQEADLLIEDLTDVYWLSLQMIENR